MIVVENSLSKLIRHKGHDTMTKAKTLICFYEKFGFAATINIASQEAMTQYDHALSDRTYVLDFNDGSMILVDGDTEPGLPKLFSFTQDNN